MASQIAASFIFLPEPGPSSNPSVPYDKIPDSWKNYRWRAIDVLYIMPFVVTSSYNFALGTGDDGKSSLQKRFEWVVANARDANANMRIIACAGTDDHDWRNIQTDDQVNTYTSSMAAFMKDNLNKTLVSDMGRVVSARINGFDVDYEWGTPVVKTPMILHAIRAKFNTISTSPPLYLSMTPAWIDEPLKQVQEGTLDFVNMQRYDGGACTTGDAYLKAIKGLKPEQLVYGISAEMPWVSVPRYTPGGTKPTGILSDVFKQYDQESQHKYGGMFVWRINSNNDSFENMVQMLIYNKVHSTTLQGTPPFQFVSDGWDANGGKKGVPDSMTPILPWSSWNWPTAGSTKAQQ